MEENLVPQSAPIVPPRELPPREVGIYSLGLTLMGAGILSACSILGVFLPRVVGQLLLPGYFVLLGLETLLNAVWLPQGRRLKLRGGLIALAVIAVLVMQAGIAWAAWSGFHIKFQ